MDCVARPLHKERKLGIDLKVLDPELVPAPTRPASDDGLDRGPTHPLLDRRKIINCNHPTEPTTTEPIAPDRLTKWRLVSRRVIQNTDHLEILPPSAARSSCGCRTVDGTRRREKALPAALRVAVPLLPGLPVRPRTTGGPSACPHCCRGPSPKSRGPLTPHEPGGLRCGSAG